jgi:CDP-diacylglycerol--glycerol-3-phosphate 3-phosphatidyltransferase
MLGKPFIRKYISNLLSYFTKIIARIGIPPNVLTSIGLLFALIAAYHFALGRFFLAGILTICSGIFDLLDGKVAEATGTTSPFGAFLDSVVDRYSDTAVLVGLILFYTKEENVLYVIATSITLIGFIMVSYTKSRAETLIGECQVGLMERPERILVLSLAALLNRMDVGIWILLIFTHLTAFQRIFYTWKKSKEIGSAPKA